MAKNDLQRRLTERFVAETRSLFVYLRDIGHWRPQERASVMAGIFAVADDDLRHAAALAGALDRMGTPAPNPGFPDYTHLHYARPEFLLPACIRQKEESIAAYDALPDLSDHSELAELIESIRADERRHLRELKEQHRRVGELLAAAAAAEDVI